MTASPRHLARIAAPALIALAVVATGCTGSEAADGSSDASRSSSASSATTIAAATTTSTTSTTTTTIPPTTTTTIPLVTEGASVMVANAAGVPGAAAELTNALGRLGFVMGEPTNAAAWDEELEATKVYATPAADGVAQSVARVLGGVPVERMPTPAPIRGANETLGDTGVLVMLGADLAAEPLPG